jgi:hypothetical protein
MSDLKKLGSFTYGGPPENQTRYQGIVGMRQAHGLHNVKFVPYPVGDRYPPLNRHRVDTIAIFTTDGQLLARHYAILSAPRSAALGPPGVPSCFRSASPLRHWAKRAGRGAVCAPGLFVTYIWAPETTGISLTGRAAWRRQRQPPRAWSSPP